MTNRPNIDEFAAMNDEAFCAWWDAAMEAVQAVAVSEAEIEAVAAERMQAERARFAETRAEAEAIMASEPDNGDRFW